MEILDTLKDQIGVHCDEILDLFKNGAKITIIVTNDKYGDAGVLVTNDDLDRVIKEIEKRKLEIDKCQK